jgi:single-strand DNA-binding protein
MYLNTVQLMGFTGHQAEAKETSGGKPYTRFSIATKSTWMKDGERQRTEWHSVIAWGKLGAYAAGFKQGAHIMVEGELRNREYERGSDGIHMKTYEVVARVIKNLRPHQRIDTNHAEELADEGGRD